MSERCGIPLSAMDRKSDSAPSRGEIWMVDLNPVRGHEQGGRRPGLVVSVDFFNHSPADIMIMLPITSREKNVISHVEVLPPEGGLRQRSFIKCEDIRSLARGRLTRKMGRLTLSTMNLVEDRLKILLGLS
jgi:mRNA interferase MazF